MPNTGTGYGTPLALAGFPGTGVNVVRPIPYTLLNLGRYAQIMGINPAHFCRAYAPGLNPVVFPNGTCNNLWPRHSWQNADQGSLEELAYAIHGAEEDIARLVGYYPAPTWIDHEPHPYPRYYDRQYFGDGFELRGNYKSVRTDFGLIVSYGKRAVTLLAAAQTLDNSLQYTDEDGDGVSETATITLPTTETDARVYKVYFSGHDGEQEWEVRPVRKMSISGGFLTILIDSWNLIDPEIAGAYPDDGGFRVIDISTTANFVASVEVYKEYANATVPHAEFHWEADLTCLTATPVSQTGFINSRNASQGLVVPMPGSYSGGTWGVDDWAGQVEPNEVDLWYYAGHIDKRYQRGASHDPLSDWWAQTIAWIATARLERPMCGCGNIQSVADALRNDLAVNTQGESHFTTVEVIGNPLGTRMGEVMAWRRISKIAPIRLEYAVI